MSTNKKVSLVIGSDDGVNLIQMYDELSNQGYNFQLHAISTNLLLKSTFSDVNSLLYEDIKDMPGYLRNLESNIANSDIIVCYESHHLASFQALRSGLKHNIPVIVHCDEVVPFRFSEHANIRAIQTDIYNNASVFIASSAEAKDVLVLEGVNPERIWVQPMPVMSSKFYCKVSARDKFRSYIGVKPEETLVIYDAPMCQWARHYELLNSMLLLRRQDEDVFSRTKLLFAGTGPTAEDLKYRSYDFGVQDRILYLHQSYQDFEIDLFNAGDIQLFLRPGRDGIDVFESPSKILNHVACGGVPLTSTGTIAGALLDEIGDQLSDDSYQNISQVIAKWVRDPASLKHQREHMLWKLESAHGAVELGQNIKNIFSALLPKKQTVPQSTDFTPLLEKAHAFLNTSDLNHALEVIEDLVLRAESHPGVLSKAMKLKGDILVKKNLLEKATESYWQSVQLDDTNSDSFLGLGNLAYKSYSYEEALSFYKRVLARNEQNSEALLGVGMIHRKMGLAEESLPWLKRCVEIDAGNTLAINAISQACLECSDPRRPVEVLEDIMEITGDNKALQIALGKLYLSQGKLEEGRKLVAKAIS